MKIVTVLAVLLLLLILFKPRFLPRLLGSFGRSLRSAGQVGRELASGEEEPGSPLARYEVQAGELVLMRVKSTVTPSRDENLLREVQVTGEAVARGARRREIPYRFTVIEDAEPNAFAVPGGSVFISHSLIELCEGNRDSLAGVLGHEVAHIDLRHAVFQLAARAAARTGAGLLGRTVLLRHVAGQMEELLVKGYSQDKELEADLVGAELARSSGHDPRGFAYLLRKLAVLQPQSNKPLWQLFRYFSSHPPIEERIRQLDRRYGR